MVCAKQFIWNLLCIEKVIEKPLVGRVKQRSFNLHLLVKPYVRISRIRLSSGISHNRKRNNPPDLVFSSCSTIFTIFARWRFRLLFFRRHTFLVSCYLIVLIVLSTSSLSRSEPLRWVRFFPLHSRPLHPSIQVLCVISLSFIATIGSSDSC